MKTQPSLERPPTATTDAAGQKTHSDYAVDGRRIGIRYVDETIPTADVTLTWDEKYPRVASMVDGIGTTTYGYHAPGAAGGGRIATIDGPLADDTLAYSYDDLGRLSARSLDGTSESFTYDTLGRMTAVTNPLDTFALTYDGANGLLLTLTGTKGLGISRSYFGATGDYRVQESTYSWGGSQGLGEFGYEYDVLGRITQWDHTVGAADPRRVNPQYDKISRLVMAGISNPATSLPISSEINRYDRAGNRIGQQKGEEVTTSSFNALNQLQSVSSGGEMTLVGAMDEPGTVTVGGKTVRTDATNRFSLEVPVVTGANALTVVSEDVNANTTTNTVSFNVASSGSRSFTYDANGNTLSDGIREYSWDGANRLVKITYTGTGNYTDFFYDGLGRRTRMKEVVGGSVTEDNTLVYDGAQIVEKRDASINVVERRYYGLGFQAIVGSVSTEYFYVRDHLGSVRGLVDEDGVERGRWSYSLWGARSGNQVVTDPIDSDMGYTGHYEHVRSNLVTTWYRFYDPAIARWLSRDPIGEEGEMNLYGYVGNNPINLWDPLGLERRALTPIEQAAMQNSINRISGLAPQLGEDLQSLLWKGKIKIDDELSSKYGADGRVSKLCDSNIYFSDLMFQQGVPSSYFDNVLIEESIHQAQFHGGLASKLGYLAGDIATAIGSLWGLLYDPYDHYPSETVAKGLTTAITGNPTK